MVQEIQLYMYVKYEKPMINWIQTVFNNAVRLHTYVCRIYTKVIILRVYNEVLHLHVHV